MAFLIDPEFWARWLSIVILDLTLAGDNALVIALAVRTLPRKQQFWGRVWGSLGAVGLRLIFITIITYLLRIPLLQFVGGVLLIWIALKLVRQTAGEEGEGHVRQGTSLFEAIWIIIVADVVMSLDNVLAVAGAAHGNLVLVVFGIAFSLPLVVWGSGILARLMNRYPWIIWLGGGILGYVAGEMMLKDPWIAGWLGEAITHALHSALPLFLGVVLTALGWWFARRVTAKAH
ncbi:MAG TPA: TerC family protein [Methylomirabilota bacterium]|nr:TerC family protein [Methylomirabilota bacterium]